MVCSYSVTNIAYVTDRVIEIVYAHVMVLSSTLAYVTQTDINIAYITAIQNKCTPNQCNRLFQASVMFSLLRH